MAMRKNYGLFVSISILMVFSAVGCAPSSFVKSSPGWKVIELRDELRNNYDQAWQTTVDTIAKQWDIEILDKESGYLRTTWTYGISGGVYNRYRGRLTVKYPEGSKSDKLELKTEAQWAQDVYYGIWVTGFDTNFNRDVYSVLAGRLGRTVPTE
jgi:hypothetical protein